METTPHDPVRTATTTSAASPQETTPSSPKNTIYGRFSFLIVICGIVLLGASVLLPWVHIDISDGLSLPKHTAISGKNWSPSMLPLLVALACGTVAQLLVRGKFVYFVGLILILIEGIAMVGPITALGTSPDTQFHYIISAHLVPDRYTLIGITTAIVGPVLAVIGSLIAIFGTVMSIRHPRKNQGERYVTPSMKKKALEEKVLRAYEEEEAQRHLSTVDAPTTSAGNSSSATSNLTGADLWDAQDAGIDLTDK